MSLTIDISKDAGAAIVSADGVTFCESPASAIIQQESLNLNGVQVFSNSEVSVSDIMLKRAFMSSEMRAPVGDALFKLTDAETPFIGTTVKIGHAPVGGIFSYDGSIPGGQWSLSTNLKSDIVNNLFATGRTTAGLTAAVTKVDFMACFVTPINDIFIPPVSIMTLYELDVQSQSKSTTGASTLAYQVPLSTRKIFVETQLDDKSATDAKGGTALDGPHISELSCEYAGMVVPNLRYTNNNVDNLRAYLELYQGKRFASKSVYSTFTQWNEMRMYGLNFAKPPSDTSTNLIVRMTNASTAAESSQIYVGALWTQALTLTYGVDGFITSVNFSVMN